jgi:Bacterial membrane protein YfhO
MWRRAQEWRLSASPDTQALLLIAAVVVLANALYLSGTFDPNPLNTWSGLGQVTKAGIIGGLPTIDPNNGVTSQTFGHLAVQDWFHLRAPWWNPFEGTGAPLAGEMVSAALFPFTIFTAISNGQMFERLAFELLTGAATYLLLRRLAVGRLASAGAAIAFALNGTFAWFSHAPINVIAFLPLLLLGIELAFAASVEGRSGGWWLIAVAAALSLYGGFPETAYIDALLAVLWFLWRCGCADRAYLRTFVIKVAFGAIVALLLAAPILVAFADYEAHTFNAHGAGAFANVHLPHAALPQLMLPYVYGPIFGFADAKGEVDGIWGAVGGYLSISLLLFALLGLVSPGRRALRAILFAWIVLAFARIYGEPPGLGRVIGVLPDMGQIAFLRYADPALELAVVVLAALGMDSLRTQPAPRRRIAVVTLVSLAVLAAATIGAIPLVHRLIGATHRDYSRGSVIWAVLVLVVGAVACVLPNPRARRILAALLVSIDALALFVLPELSAPRTIKLDTAPVAFLQSHLGLSRFATLGPLAPNYGTYYGLRSLNADDALLPSDFATYLNAHLDPAVEPLIFNGTPPGRPPAAPTPEQELLTHLNGYRQAGVRYVLTPPNLPLPAGPDKFRLVLRSPTTWIYRLAGTSPYFTVTNSACTVRALGGQSARVSCSSPTTLVRRETYMSGWTAKVDGKAQPIREYDGDFQAVTVGPGTHRVTFGYAPPRIGWALVGFVLGLLSLIAAPFLARRRRPGGSPKASL